MAIKRPKNLHKTNAYPTKLGWTIDRGKGKTEVLKKANFSASDIAEWYAEQNQTPVVEKIFNSEPAPMAEPTVPEIKPEPITTGEQKVTRGVNPKFYKNPETGRWEKKPSVVAEEAKIQSLSEAPASERPLSPEELAHHYGGKNTIH